MKLVNIKTDYIEYLQKFSTNIKYNKEGKRPYVGIILKISNVSYFAPLGSPKAKHVKMKSNLDFIKIKNGELGIISLNNMIPVPNEFIKDISYDKYDRKYVKLLHEQKRWIIRNKEIILSKTEKLYRLIVEKKGTIFHKRSNDFKLLEEKAIEYEREKKLKFISEKLSINKKEKSKNKELER